jgi:tetratricopeptide (TPR) repeat protein
MADIANVNLLFLRRIRGIAPLSRFALQSDGTLFVSVPDEMEPRTAHIARYEETGRSRLLHSYQVETLRKTEIGVGATHFLGTTEDDLYLFNEGKKSRFQPDRRVSFTDVALAENGARFVCAFCDLMQSVSTLALGETGGRLLWHKDIAFEVTRVALTRSGEFLAVAGAGGEIALYDAARHVVLNHRQDDRIDAIATLGPERTAFACRGDGESTGGVGCVGPDGRLLWFTELLGQPVELAIAGGGIVAVLLATDTHAGRLVFLSEDGLPLWDIDYDEARPTGLSLSPDARRVAVTLRDGTLALYELQLAERLSLLSDEIALAEARRTIESGNLDGALKLLRGRLIDAPGDLGCAALLARTLTRRLENLRAEAQQAEAVGDWRAADAVLERAQALAPLDAALTAERAALRTRWKQAALDSARKSPTPEQAEAHLLEAIEADPLANDARAALVLAREQAARDAVQRGRQLLAIGEASEALKVLIEARRRGATGNEADDLLRTARVGEALSLGNQLYNDRQWAAALFQYKKVLRLDPRHEEARQKVGYAQNFLADNTLSERFTRLE